MRKIILQTLMPWTRRQAAAAGVPALDARADQTLLATEVLHQASRLLADPQAARGTSEQQVQGFCKALVEASSHLRLAWVWFGDPQAEFIVPGIVAGPAAALGRELHIQRNLLTMQGPAFRALKGKRLEPFNVSESSLYAPWRDAAVRHGVRSVLALPLKAAGDDRRGVFVLYADVPDYFNLVGISLFDGIAELIVSVLAQSARQVKLERAAHTDALTGLFNRAYAQELIEGMRQTPLLLPVSLLLLDIDCFKVINDSQGHAAGDAVLRSCAERLRSVLRQTDGVARWGGEEFVVWLPGTNQLQAMVVAEKLRAAVAQTPHLTTTHQRTLSVTMSIGVTEVRHAEDLELALARADRAMYAAKALGRNRVQAVDVAPVEMAPL
jgi:diguanylate cyclase (GGDEF)-like protein